MTSLSKHIDKITNNIEAIGFLKEAYQLDIISNTIDALYKTANIDNLQNKWKQKGIDLRLFESDNDIELSKVIVPKTQRNEGIGTQIMNDIIKYADNSRKKIILSPSTDFGGSSINRLVNFYKQFGFVENKGKNKDFSTMKSMYRLPK